MTRAPILDFFKPVISFLFKFAPYLISWIITDYPVHNYAKCQSEICSCLISGIVAGTILQILQWLYIDLQFGITKLSAIYGSFAAVPLFIYWLQSSWIVVLLGAELSFANQNFSHYELESESLNISNYQKRALVIMILHMIIRNFSIGEKPISAETIAHILKFLYGLPGIYFRILLM